MDLNRKITDEIRRFKEEYHFQEREILENIDLSKYIDHTLLKPEATPNMVKELCEEAIEHSFFSVCVNSAFLPLVNDMLKGSEVKRAVVIGFPLGAVSTDVKVFETKWCLAQGVDEFDMVINVGYLKAGLYQEVYDDIKAVVEASKGKTVKVIIETALLTDEEKIAACVIAKEAGAQFVKTSTGFSKAGATVEDVSLMKFVVGEKMKVKASGGVRTREMALAMIKAGADRIGTSSGIKIVNG
ncbi:deoxyribose-phosphate aldolase [Kosmotoga arenicorallina S304]|uniref:Deoxyribose-phosphate aldolase n=1 Tax=Kosmotoga arenicorallina S304 TaxID=1453497 RepID=A0A176K001_9BACT|nr:deoxyribose-phosphate aldolase [Kosmotoga arenicorallina]OAA29726.1 deoxyribose-phosphate aldolase [Kosmotoga arenicorallina S304]